MHNLFTTHMELFCNELNMIELVEWIFTIRNGRPTLDYTATNNAKNMCQDSPGDRNTLDRRERIRIQKNY